MNTTMILQLLVMHIPKELNCEKIKYVWQISSRNLKVKFINTPSIHIEHNGKTFNSNIPMKFFLPKQFCLWLILQKTTHLLHKKRFKVNTIILTKFQYLSIFYIDILNRMLMALKSHVIIMMWLNNITFISVMIVHMNQILFNIVLKLFSMIH